jgi:hypothetical protein
MSVKIAPFFGKSMTKKYFGSEAGGGNPRVLKKL